MNETKKINKDNPYFYNSSLSITSNKRSTKDKKAYCEHLINVYSQYGFKWLELKLNNKTSVFEKYAYIRSKLKNTEFMCFTIASFPILYKIRDNLYKVLIKKRNKFFKNKVVA